MPKGRRREMGIPQIIWIGLYAMALGMSLANDGKVKEKKESFMISCLAVGIQASLLWWGGFFG